MVITEAVRSAPVDATERPPLHEFCSVVAAQAHEDPIGSARYFDRYLLVEISPPWPGGMMRPVWDFPNVSVPLQIALQGAMSGGSLVKSLAITPDPAYSVPGYTRVLMFDRPLSPFTAYDRWSYLVPNDQVVPLVEALAGARPAALDRFEAHREPNDGTRDLLVCTHGSVDACCAKFGYPLYRVLRESYVDHAPGRLRVWRVSSIGGHRFAPTLIDMPEGRFWGHIREEQLDWLTRRTGPMDVLRGYYRGWGALWEPYAQVVEQEVFLREGWSWVTYRKLFETVRIDETGTRFTMRVTFESPDGQVRGIYDATVEFTETLPVLIGCSGLLGEADKYRVTELARRA